MNTNIHEIFNSLVNDAINDFNTVKVRYPNIVFANGKNVYIKKAFRRNKAYREAILVKATIFDDIDSFYEFGYDMTEVKKACKEEGLSISAVKAGLNYYGQKTFDYLIVGQLPPIPSTREVIRVIKNRTKYVPQDDEEILF